MIQSLKKQNHKLSSPKDQIEILSDVDSLDIPAFESKLNEMGHSSLKPTSIEIFQVNVGKMCNQVCNHCHVDASPDRKEIMTRETMVQCLDAIRDTNIKIVDITGGAPEMNPNFKWFVEQLSLLKMEIIVRCNLTIIVANHKYLDLPDFFKKHKVNVVSSLPYFNARRTDAQRGEGVFDKSIKALQMLNAVGYGKEDSDLKLDLVYNPAGAFLPGDQLTLENEFKKKLLEYNITFNDLFTITNLPVSRFLEYLVRSENYQEYMIELVNAFNPVAAEGVMCRNTISVGWDGFLYDCDFNQMLELKVKASDHIRDFDLNELTNRDIIVNQHCYGCTAGAGSSCGGATA
jgi:radical SAM/Cys-rich protein